ncbi:MAG: response regulator [Bacteroidales bacterium]|nr:response regulator [Bacteroidales bacterium]MCF8336465.1 response regulator [Bacteroidales bacterium]
MNRFKKIQQKLAALRANRLKSFSHPGQSGLKVLVVDDEKINQSILSSRLKKLGIIADVAGNGHESLSMIAAKHYDIVFMDIEMPVMDGLEATKKIKAVNGERPYIVGFTTLYDSSYHTNCLEAGMDNVLPKKISELQLNQLLENISKKKLNG